MGNPSPVVDFSTWIADFLGQTVGDGIWADVLAAPKVDDVAADASDQSTNAAQLWANAQDDMFNASWIRLYADRKVWRGSTLFELEARGLQYGVQAGDLGHVDASDPFAAGLYECTNVGPTSSTWTTIAGGGGTPQDLATTLGVGFVTGNRPIVHEGSSYHEWRGPEISPGVYLPIARTQKVDESGATLGGGGWVPVTTVATIVPPPGLATDVIGAVTVEGVIHYLSPPDGLTPAEVRAVRFSESWEYTTNGILTTWTQKSTTTDGDTGDLRLAVNASSRLELQRQDLPPAVSAPVPFVILGYFRRTEAITAYGGI